MSPRAWLLLAALAAGGCSRDWRTDMWYQPSRRGADAPRPQPEGSIPLGAEPLPVDRDDAEALPNPVQPSPASLARGRALFAARCAPCHGAEGHGGGPVSRYFPVAPDLAYITVRQRTDGYLFGTITFGGRAMPSQAEGLSIGDRWDLVNHVRAIQGQIAAP
jgi:S-disulfanyl-L-cysteine oxidoreductase SoxD